MLQIRDIDLGFVIKSQLWATAIITLISVAMLGVIHCALCFLHTTACHAVL